MALSLGTLFVKLNADPSALVNGLNTASTRIEQFGQRLKQTSEKLTGLGMALSAAGIGAVAVAAQFDQSVKSSLDELKGTMSAISVDIGRSFVPAMESLNDVLTFFGNMLARIDPNTKEFVASLVAFSGIALLVAGALTKIIALGMTLAPLFSSALAPAIGAVSAAFLPLLALLAAVVAFVPLIADEWTNFTTFMANSWRKALKSITEAWGAVQTWFFGMINSIGEAWSKFTGTLWELFAKAMKKVGEYAGKVAKMFGLDWQYELEAFNETIDDMASQGFQPLVDMASDAGSKIGQYLGESVNFAKDMIVPGWQMVADKWTSGARKLKNGIEDIFSDLFSGFDKKLEGVALLTKGVEKPAGAGSKTMAPTIVMEAVDVEVPFKNATAKWEDGVALAGENLLQGLGSFTEIMNAATQGMAAGGPIGAAVGAIVALVMKSQFFATAIESLTTFVQSIADMLGRILGPQLAMFGAVLKAITPIVETVMKILGGPLFLALKGIALVVLGVTWVVGQVWNFIMGIVTWLFNTIGDALNAIWGGAGQGMKDAAAAMSQTMVDIAGIEKDMGEISRLSLDSTGQIDSRGTRPIEVLGNAATQTATTLERLNAALTNVPAGFKTAAARFNAASPDIYNFGLGGTRDIEVNLNLDGRVIHKQIIIQNARGQYIHRGGMMPSKWWGS